MNQCEDESMTTKVNERESGAARISKKKPVNAVRPVATWILLLVLIVMLLAPLV
jgi:hypothetical protein